MKRADVGVALGIKGTEAAKEVAQVVLADDDFASMVNVVREGRTVYYNLQKALCSFCRSTAASRSALPVLSGSGGGTAIALHLCAIHGAFLRTRPIGIVNGLPVIAAGVALFTILELEKLMLRRS